MNTTSQNISEQLRGHDGFIAGPDDRILITGAAGFIGCRVVRCLLDHGFRNLVCFVRPSSDLSDLDAMTGSPPAGVRVDVVKGNLLAPKDCEAASKGVAVILHLAAGTGEKSFPDAFLNSVVATRNLLDASVQYASLRRFLLVSSFAVYSNREKPNGRLLDESCPIDARPELRGEAYCFAKVKQEEIVGEYGKNRGIPYVIVRPGSVYGPVASEPTGRIGVGTFGPYLHLGGSNTIPFTHVDNCAEAMVLAALTHGVDGEVFNIVDDNLPSSRNFLCHYKKCVGSFRSIYLPHFLSYALCFIWEKYSGWSKGQLPPVFNRRRWHVEWKKTRFSNKKLKTKLGWKPRVSTEEGLRQYAEACGRKQKHA
jgi:nucleoside-diphosphate-sugar epimerase